jgi:hypothetical protein
VLLFPVDIFGRYLLRHQLLLGLYLLTLLTACGKTVQPPPGFDARIASIPVKNIAFTALGTSVVENLIAVDAHSTSGDPQQDHQQLAVILSYRERGAKASIAEAQQLAIGQNMFLGGVGAREKILLQTIGVGQPLQAQTTGPGGWADVTPKNMDTVAAEAKAAGGFMLLLSYADSAENLLAQAAAGAKETLYWSGKGSLSPVSGTAGARIEGSGFDAQGYHEYLLTPSGIVLKLDAAKAAFKRDQGFDWVAAGYNKLSAVDRQGLWHYVLADGIVGFELNDSYRFQTKAGQEYSVKKIQLASTGQSGVSGTSAKGGQAQASQALVKAGKTAGLDQALSSSLLVAINRTTVGILDVKYYRLTTFKAK